MPRFILAFAIFSSLSIGQGMTPEQRQAVLDYNLSMPRANQLIAALPEMTRFFLSLPPDQRAKAIKASPAESLANAENNPTSAAILKKNGLTAREYIVGVPALRMALMAAQGSNGPNIVASPANIAFAKANLADLKPRFEAADSVGRPAK